MISRREAKALLAELMSTRLTVVLIPAPDARHEGHMIRIAVERNPGWYSRLFASRRYGVKRARVVAALRRAARGRGLPAGYENDLAPASRPKPSSGGYVPF